MSLQYIYAAFKPLSIAQKIQFLQQLQQQNLPYAINYNNLIRKYQSILQ